MAKKKENKEERILMIVESPNKIQTLKQFLPKNYVVMASVGHICKIKDGGLYNMGIDPKNNFETNYVISDDKKDVVKKLKEQVKAADIIYLATDGDREGEAIAYHLKNFLKIPEKKYQRITFHEITKSAVMEALDHPRKIDDDLVKAALGRGILDKIVGYRLSPVARKALSCKSVGRCQSAGLKILVDREEEILNFNSTRYYELYLNFTKNNNKYTAKYIGTDKKEIKQFEDLSDAKEIIRQCKGNDFVIKSIESKDRNVNPKLPFTTSTFQQEVSNKLGITVKSAMSYAQRLFEGINIGGEHKALITYIRTDSTDMAPEFVETLSKFVLENYGKEYYSPVRKGKKKDTDQDGHEALRCVDVYMTPDKLKEYISDSGLLKVYSIIWSRTVAASMSASIITDTDYNIYNKDNKFILRSHSVKFDGYRKVYGYKEDEEELDNSYSDLVKGYVIEDPILDPVEKITKPPKRYNESSFVNILEKSGVGRPSTFASILSTLIDPSRGYCVIEDKLIVPTEKGIRLSHYLDENFSDIINVNYTAEMEKSLDKISSGELNDIEFLTDFYNNLDNNITKVGVTKVEAICPECGGKLKFRRGKFGPFWGCENYPRCKYTAKSI